MTQNYLESLHLFTEQMNNKLFKALVKPLVYNYDSSYIGIGIINSRHNIFYFSLCFVITQKVVIYTWFQFIHIYYTIYIQTIEVLVIYF